MKGKAWEIWSGVMTSGEQIVDTQGVVPDYFSLNRPPDVSRYYTAL